MPLLAAAMMLAPIAAMSAASPEEPAKISDGVEDAPPAAVHLVRDDDQTWMMLPVGLAAVGFAVRRQQRVIDPLQPQVH
jgi:hypothetical protein